MAEDNVDYADEAADEATTEDAPTVGQQTDEASDETTSEVSEEQRKIAALEKQILDTKRGFTERSMELAELRGQIKAMTAQNEAQPKADQLKELVDSLDDDKLNENPAM